MSIEKSKVFVSYSRKDGDFALKLSKELKSHGLNIWLDKLDIKPGDIWEKEIENAIETSGQFLIILTPSSVSSENVMDELSYSIHEGKIIIPVLFVKCKVPFRIRRRQHCDFTGSFEEGLGHLLEAFNITEVSKKKEFKIDRVANLTPTFEDNNYLRSDIINREKDFVFIKGGTFMMGSADNDKEADDDEKPGHEVKLADFYIAKTPVTQSLWNKIMDKNPSKFKGDNLPIENVNWYDAIEFCNKLSEKNGRTPYYSIDKKSKDPDNISVWDDLKWKVEINTDANGYRLPTEAEWEYAARAGNKSEGYTYAGSNNINEVAWYDKNSKKKTNPVMQKKPNGLGIYDMSGNVWECCWDWYDEKYYQEFEADRTPKNPAGPKSGSSRVGRGGSWYSGVRNCRVAFRGRCNPGPRYYGGGFRLVFVP